MFFPCSRKPLANGLLSILSFVIFKQNEQDSASQWLVGFFTVPRPSLQYLSQQINCVRVLDKALPQYLSSPSSSHYWSGTDPQTEVTLPGSAGILLEKYAGWVSVSGPAAILFTAFGVLCVTDSALNTIKVHDSSHHRVDFSTGTTMCLFLPTVHHRCPGWADRKETPSFTRILRTALCSASRSSACTPYLLVLVGSDRGEHSLREAEHLEDAPADTEEVICLHDVEARLVTVHGVQDDLGQTKDKVSVCKHCQHTANLLWRLPGHPFQTRDACWDWCLHQAPVVTVQAHAFPSRELRGHEGWAEGGRKGTWICFNFHMI